MRIASQAAGWTGGTGCAGTNAGKATAKDAKEMRDRIEPQRHNEHDDKQANFPCLVFPLRLCAFA